MSTDEDFFKENIVNINQIVGIILLAGTIVPVSFILLTLAGIWKVQHWYSCMVIIYTLITGLFTIFFNQYEKTQKLSMYFGMISVIGFVFLLGTNNLILLTLSFCMAPFLSCIYYKRNFTNIVCAVNFLSIVGIYIIRAFDNTTGKTPEIWFLEQFTGVLIEYIFIVVIANFLCSKIKMTLIKMARLADERDGANKKLKEKNEAITKMNIQLNNTQFKIIEFVAKVLGSHDLFTGFHVIHTTRYVYVIAHQLKDNGFYTEELTDDYIELMSNAAFLHDIGKIHVPEGVLNKVGRFNQEEFEVMKSHPEEGLKLLKFLPEINGGSFNTVAEQMCYSHHEKFDGSGYPCGTSGYDIPLCGRIMAAADVMDALISQRLYKAPMSMDKAIEIFKDSRGTHFEPCIADAVVDCCEKIEAIDKNFKKNETQMNAQELAWWIKYHQSLES